MKLTHEVTVTLRIALKLQLKSTVSLMGKKISERNSVELLESRVYLAFIISQNIEITYYYFRIQ